MSRLLYLDGACGISGDMAVAALLDLGADRAKLDAALAPLAREGLAYAVSRKTSHGLAGCDFDVRLPGRPHPAGGHHHHEHRNLADVAHVLAHLPMSEGARTLAERAFRIVAEAEAKAHGRPVEDIHFHEVGALDSIADIVGAAVLFDDLRLDGCVVTRLCEGSGTVTCAHGELPVPVPATLNVAQAHAIALELTAVRGERVTPTGIALAAALRTHTALPAPFVVERVGVGLGKRDFGAPNALRALIIRDDGPGEGQIVAVEANLDDCTGEVMAAAAERLLALGARDVCFVPCLMKKGRPAYILKALADAPRVPALTQALFRETTTIGVRTYPVARTVMARRPVTLATPIGDIAAKRCEGAGVVRVYPECDSVRAAAQAAGLPLPEAFALAQAAAREHHD